MNDETDEECKFKRHLGAIVFRSSVHINEIISIHVSSSLTLFSFIYLPSSQAGKKIFFFIDIIKMTQATNSLWYFYFYLASNDFLYFNVTH